MAWVWVTVLGPTILGLVLAYGLYRTSGRNRRMDAVTEAATRREYHKAGPSVAERNASIPPGPGRGVPTVVIITALSVGILLMAAIAFTSAWRILTGQ